jgi:hypothetical protein
LDLRAGRLSPSERAGSNDKHPYAGVDFETRDQAEIDRQRNEETARKAADIHWLHEGFDYAKQVGAKGVMISWRSRSTSR